MSILMDIIQEEKERLEELLKFYRNEISKLPKGYISKKNINGYEYYYLAYRKGNTVKTKFIGNKSTEELKDLRKKIEERRKLESLYRQAEENLREAERALNGKRKSVFKSIKKVG